MVIFLLLTATQFISDALEKSNALFLLVLSAMIGLVVRDFFGKVAGMVSDGDVRVYLEGIELLSIDGIERLPWSFVDDAVVIMTLASDDPSQSKPGPIQNWDKVELKFHNRLPIVVSLDVYREPQAVCERITARLPVRPKLVYQSPPPDD